MVTRRRALHVAGASLFGLAGCSSQNPNGTSTESPDPPSTTAPTPSRTPSATATATEAPEPTEGVDVDGSFPAWTRSLGATVRGDPVYADGYVVVAAGGTVYGLDADSGETAWTLDSPAVPEGDVGRHDSTLRVHDGTVYALLGADYLLGGSDYTLFALDPDGTERWHYGSGLAKYHEIADFGGGAIVLPTHDDEFLPHQERVLAIGLADGEERWRADSGDAIDGDVGEGVAAVHAGFEVLDCFDLETGDRRFRFEASGESSIESFVTGGGLVFVGVSVDEATEPTLVALDPENGEPVWTWNQMRVDSLRYLDDLYVGGGSIFRLAADGTERWRYDEGGTVEGIPFDEEKVYIHTGTRLAAISRRDGTEQWSSLASEETRPVARDGDLVLTYNRDAGVVSTSNVNGGNGPWTATSSRSFHSPATGGGSAYLATENGVVLALPV